MPSPPPPNDLSHLSDDEFSALCPQGEHAPGPEPLSPAAQAVLDAYGDFEPANVDAMAAALRAAADQVVPVENAPLMMRGHDVERLAQRQHTRAEFLAIAAELESYK
jgi:hypothetical protein